MDSKSGLGSAEDREARLKFSLLAALARSFCALIVRAPNVRPLRDICMLKELRSDSITPRNFIAHFGL